jgi:hypothetical protein
VTLSRPKKLDEQIDEAIRLHDKLSDESGPFNSHQQAVRRAFLLGNSLGVDVHGALDGRVPQQVPAVP